MKYYKYLIICLLSCTLCFLSPHKALASHINGGDMSYVSLGGGKYKIIARVFRDCRGISFTAPNFGCFAGTNGAAGCGSYTLNGLKRVAIYEISSLCRGEKAQCVPANTSSSGSGLEMQVFEDTVNFNTTPLSNFVGKSSCCEVTFYFGECCRNGLISTGPASSDFSVTCTINLCNLAKCKNKTNSSPLWMSKPLQFICCNQPLYYNYGLADTAEYDSISYNLVPALAALPKTSVSYSSPFSYLHPVTPYCVPPTSVSCSPQPYKIVPRGFFLDTQNGDMIYTPTKCDEIAVIAVEATEWRKDSTGKNYIWIGKNRREMTVFVVDDCGYNKVAPLTGQYNYEVCAGDKLCFNLKFTDSLYTPYQTKRDTIGLYWNGAIKNATFKRIADTIPNTEEAQFCWQTSASDVRDYLYHFSFTVNDSHCLRPAVASRAVNIRVKYRDTAVPSVKLVKCSSLLLSGSVKSGSSNTAYGWVVKDSLTDKTIFTSSKKTDTTKLLAKGIYKITLTTSDPTRCSTPTTLSVHIDSIVPTVTLRQDTSICKGSDYLSVSSVSKAKLPAKYSWKVNGVHKPADTLKNYQVSQISATSTLALTVTDALGCASNAQQVITALALPDVSWSPSPLKKCYFDGNFELNAYVKNGTNPKLHIWSYNGFIIDTTSGNKFHFLTSKLDNSQLQGTSFTTTVYSSLKDSLGCYNKDSVDVYLYGSPIVKLLDKNYCQNKGSVLLDSLISLPKSKSGTTQAWTCLSAPTGINPSSVLQLISGKWWFKFGNPTDTQYAGQYLIQYKVTFQTSGCYGYDTALVKVINESKLSFSPIVLCENEAPFDLRDGTKVDGNYISKSVACNYKILAFNYNPSDPKVSSTTLAGNQVFSPSSGAGRWKFQFNGTGLQCPISDTFNIPVNYHPTATFTTSPKDSAPLSSPTFGTTNTTSIPDNSSLKYHWDFGTGNIADTSSSKNPVITYPGKNATYKLSLIAISIKNCRDTSSKILKVGTGSVGVNNLIESRHYLNQNFQISGIEYRSMEIQIFDAVGKQVFHGYDNRGVELPSGVYFYQIQLVTLGGTPTFLNGKTIVQH